jgi:hypothetical protein
MREEVRNQAGFSVPARLDSGDSDNNVGSPSSPDSNV